MGREKDGRKRRGWNGLEGEKEVVSEYTGSLTRYKRSAKTAPGKLFTLSVEGGRKLARSGHQEVGAEGQKEVFFQAKTVQAKTLRQESEELQEGWV